MTNIGIHLVTRVGGTRGDRERGEWERGGKDKGEG